MIWWWQRGNLRNIFSIKTCFKKLIHQITFLHNSLSKNSQKVLSQSDVPKPKRFIKMILTICNLNKNIVFQLKIQQLVFFHTCDEIIFYNFRTTPSVVLSRLYSSRAYDIHNTVQRLTRKAYTWSHAFRLPETLRLNYYQST